MSGFGMQGSNNNNPFGGGTGNMMGGGSGGFSTFSSSGNNNPFGATAASSASSPFHAPAASGFGQPQGMNTNTLASPFGNTSGGTTTGFGNTGGGSGFGNTATTTGFGHTTSMANPFASPPPANTTNTGFAATTSTPSNPFTTTAMSPPPLQAPVQFGSTSNVATFHNNNATAPSSMGPFGNVNNAPSAAAASMGPFGMASHATTAAPVTSSVGPFGSFSNPAAPSMGPFGNTSMGGGTTTTTNSSSNNPFGAAPLTASAPIPFGTASADSMDSAMDGGGGGFAPAPNTPFGNLATSKPSGFAMSPPGKGKRNKPPRSDLPFGTPPQQSQSSSAQDSDAMDGQDEERKKKQVLLERKKKKLEELKRKKAAAAMSVSQGNSPQPGGTTTLNPMASSFTPANATQHDSSTATDASLAQRNAARFDTSAANAATRAHLPADLQAKAGQTVDYAALRSGGGGDREDLGTATSLVGTCPHMCPDEELLRREREGDIQPLELVQPGTLHPQGWTLRDTAIKRFRRSAADYKLDVPEWVRPPDVLERVCGYLEEFIMERDRQGVDPRFKDTTPPPIEVYRFIWDRTRMIRKDFILQNYVGTGGNCDARAVRCHERIARWHAMCEHQLSHISDFVVMQSQQNIQELGQTMKTLNQFYDDSLKRSRVEVPDESGNETRTDLSGVSHGCENETVQGKTPSDYDGSELVNTPAPSSRLLGKDGLQQIHHGTAEPEMRGLYILLTIDNDGGMEVMRYAAHLSRERPEIFYSEPVQLALSVYKAKKEGNYARFFRLLQSSRTPYLYACIMFKYVPQMRRLAFTIMSRTFGAKLKENGETIYDAYPLRDLKRLLCFEDEEEAMAACKHYNISVKEAMLKFSSGVSKAHVISWKVTDFTEPKDPEKGTPIPLRPKKMVSTIEKKRKGATRLAVCRGDVSGDGASISSDGGRNAGESVNFAELAKQQAVALEALRKEESKKERERALAEEAQKKKEEAKREAIRLEQERAQKEAERARKEKEEEERRIAKEREAEQQRAAEEELRRKIEQERVERARKRAEEEQRKRAELERQKREKEAAEREKQRKLEEVRREEERRRIAAEKERLRKEEEARQLELRRIQEAERRARLAEEERLTKEWNAKTDQARKLLALKRWKYRVPRNVELRNQTKSSINQMKSPLPSPVFVQPPSKMLKTRHTGFSKVLDLRSVVEGLCRSKRTFDQALARLDALVSDAAQVPSNLRPVVLVKIACFFPESNDDQYNGLSSLVNRYVDIRLGFGSEKTISSRKGELRVVFVDGSLPHNRSSCDGVLVIVPSGSEGVPLEVIDSMGTAIGDLPRAAVVLRENTTTDDECLRVQQALQGNGESVELFGNTSLEEEAVEESLLSAIEETLKEVCKRPLPSVDRMSLEHIGMLCLNRVLWLDNVLESRDGLLEAAKKALNSLVDELNMFGETGLTSWNWPCREFISNEGLVPRYFEDGLDLPDDWHKSLLRENVMAPLQDMAFRLSGSVPQVLSKVLIDAPVEIVEECHDMFEHRMFRRCLQRALIWRQQNPEPWQTDTFIYMPSHLVERIIQRSIDAIQSPLSDENALSESSFEDTSSDEIEDRVVPLPTVEAQYTESPTAQDFEVEEGLLLDSPLSRKRSTASREKEIVSRPSKRLRDSQAFTRRLEAMASGDYVPTTFVGKLPLSSLLRNAPPPRDPTTAKQRNELLEDFV